MNTLAGEIGYSIVFSNDLKHKDSYSHEYTRKIDKNDENVYTVSEDGAVIGYGRKRIDRITNAILNYILVASGEFVGSRVSGLYATYTLQTLPLTLVSKTLGIDEINGVLNYTDIYTDDTSLRPESGIKRAEVQYVDSLPTNLVNVFDVPNAKQIIQPVSGVPNITKRNLSLSLLGSRNLGMTGYVNYSVAKAAQYIPQIGGIDTFLADCNYSWQSGSNTFDFSCEWQNFSGGSYWNDINNLNLL